MPAMILKKQRQPSISWSDVELLTAVVTPVSVDRSEVEVLQNWLGEHLLVRLSIYI